MWGDGVMVVVGEEGAGGAVAAVDNKEGEEEKNDLFTCLFNRIPL